MDQLSWMGRANFVYGAIGLALIIQLGSGDGASWRSFVAGWAVAVVNLSLIRRIGTRLLDVYEGGKPGISFYLFLFGKFAFWGLVIALFSTASWLQAIPFVAGMTTLLVAGLAFGVRELIYAR